MFEDPVKEFIYKSDYDGLKLYVFDQPQLEGQLKPAILFFHGAGFSNNKVTPAQFQHQAEYFASLGRSRF
ncbi:hypothetical protein [Fontibacillus sp. BL9]|uniref:hypothetical protein n=1 Tax=Fontibacillus sp. BL9 TaxID=3389971 RepID=UPI003978E80E